MREFTFVYYKYSVYSQSKYQLYFDPENRFVSKDDLMCNIQWIILEITSNEDMKFINI